MIPAAALVAATSEILVPAATADHVRVRNYCGSWSIVWSNLIATPHAEVAAKDAIGLWSPVTLLDGQTARRASSVESVGALIVDMDHGEKWGETLARWPSLCWWAYTTFSHTSEAHRFRVVFPLARPVPAAEWKLRWKLGMDALDIGGKPDKSCTDTCRLYYLPSHAAGAEFGTASQDGALLDLLAITEPETAPAVVPASTRGRKPRGKGDYKTLDLAAWAAANNAHPRRENGGEGRVWVDCPWKAEHTGGLQGPTDTYLLDKGDGWPIFRCAHGHCRERGTHAILEAWPNVDEFCASDYVPPRPPTEKPAVTGDSDDEPKLEWPVCHETTDKKTGEVRRTIPGCEANALAWLKWKHDEIAYNELTGDVELSGTPATEFVCGQLLVDVQTLTQSVFQGRHIDGAMSALVADPGTRSYHPVRDYLESLPQYDGTPTICDLISTGIIELQDGADEELCQEYLLRFFVGAVARQMSPGCKHDCALILQGPQGLGKSSFFRAILPNDRWFSDSMGALEDKDSRLILSRAWIFEWSELESIRRSNMGAVKAFLSAQSDDVRAPYARSPKLRQRTCVIVGSTNDDQFISDPTGARRFWVIPVRTIDRVEVRRYRDRLWSEALAIYRDWANAPAAERSEIPPWALSAEMDERQRAANENLVDTDPWELAVLEWVKLHSRLVDGGNSGVETSVPEVLSGALNIPQGSHGRSHQIRVGQILTNAKWTRVRIQDGGNRRYVYRRRMAEGESAVMNF